MAQPPIEREQRALQPLVALRLAFKGLRRSRGTTALAVSILALGLAFPATFFSFLVGAIRPLPVPEGDRVVRIDIVQPEHAGRPLAPTGADLVALGTPGGLEALAAFREIEATLIDPGSAATRLSAAALTAEVLPLLRILPELGRVPTLEEAGHTVLIGHSVWEQAYDSDPAVLGRSVDVTGVARTIVGIMPEGFGFPFKQDAWVIFDPTVLGDPTDATVDPIEFVGRLAEGATLDGVRAEVAGRWTQSDALRPPERRGGVADVQSFTGGRGEGGETVAFVGLVLVALCLLLIACANVANLLLVRASERVRALAVQSALGASRLQIGVQLFIEALLIAVAGGALGLLIAWVLVDAVQNGLGAAHWGYYWMRMAIDGRVVAFTSALVVGTALVAGTLPIVSVLRIDLQRVLKEESSGSQGGGGGGWRRAFISAQLALSCGALVAAGLTGRSLSRTRDIGGDLPVAEILMSAVSLDGGAGPGTAHDLIDRLGAEPGVVVAAIANGAPGYLEPWARFELDGDVYDRPEDRPRTGWNGVSEGFFPMFDLEIRAGRGFGPQDEGAGAAPVALVNESFVERHSPDRSVLGRSVRIVQADGEAAWRTVVGVVSDAAVGEGEGLRLDRIYVPWDVEAQAADLILVRSRGDASPLAPAVRRAVAEVDPRIPLWSTMTLEDGLAYMTRLPRVISAFAVAGGLAGLLVAAVGLYGLLAFRVRQRRREMGVRLALGADGARLAQETLLVALRQLVPAVVVGLSLAWLASPILAVVLLGTDPRSPSTFVAVGVGFLTVGMIAATIPAIRAAATDPAHVLRGN